MKYAINEAIWAGNLCHEQVGRDFLREHWLTPNDVKFIKKTDENLIEIIAKKELTIPREWKIK